MRNLTSTGPKEQGSRKKLNVFATYLKHKKILTYLSITYHRQNSRIMESSCGTSDIFFTKIIRSDDKCTDVQLSA